MPESTPKRELSCGGIREANGGIYEADVGICEADGGISEIDEGTGVGVDDGVLVDDDVDKEVSVAADTVSNSCLRVACRAARGIDC